MTKSIHLYDNDLKELALADNAVKIYTVAIISGDDVIEEFDTVRKSDYDRIVNLYNACINGIKDKELTWKFHEAISETPNSYFI